MLEVRSIRSAEVGGLAVSLHGMPRMTVDDSDASGTVNPTPLRPLKFQADHLPASGPHSFVTITAGPEPSPLGRSA